MILIGCDFHSSWQQISWFDEATGETGEQKLVHATGDAEKFYRQLPEPALIGMESTGNCQIMHHAVLTADGISYSACCWVLRVLGSDKFFEKSLGRMSRTMGWLRPTYESVSAKF